MPVIKTSRKPRLLELMASGVKFVHACRAAGVSVATGWRWRRDDPAFRRGYEAASATLKYRRFKQSFDRLQETFRESPAAGQLEEVS